MNNNKKNKKQKKPTTHSLADGCRDRGRVRVRAAVEGENRGLHQQTMAKIYILKKEKVKI